MATFLTFAFDTVAPKFYSEEDSKRGYMLLKGERLAGMRVNFVSILIGGIVDGFNLIPSVDVLLERLFEAKKLSQIPSGSNYVIERTKLMASDSVVSDLTNRNIYIEEKDESLGYLIRTALELQGYDIQEKLDVDSANVPSVIVIDCGNEMSELEYLRKLKLQQNFAQTKIIVTTTVHDKTAVLNSGADLYLPKPYEISDLIRWVEYFLK